MILFVTIIVYLYRLITFVLQFGKLKVSHILSVMKTGFIQHLNLRKLDFKYFVQCV